MTSADQHRSRVAPALWPTAIGYLALRLLLTAVLAFAIWGAAALVGLQMPVLVAVLLAVILQLPLAWLLFDRQRERLSEAVEAAGGRRRQVRAELQAALDGTAPDGTVSAGAGPDGPASDGADSDRTVSGDAAADGAASGDAAAGTADQERDGL